MSIGLIDVGGTKLLAAVSPDGETVGPAVRRSTPQQQPLETLRAMLDEVRGGSDLDGIAMAVPGPFDRDAGALVNPPGMPQSWWGLQLAAELGARYGCTVLLENDANAAALAEATVGAGRGHRCVIYYTVSTGIGTGIVRDGVLHHNAGDTEGGHQVLWPRWLGGPACHCGGHGCLEAVASGLALQRRHGRPAEEIEDQEVWDEEGRWLGLAAVNATAILDADCVVFGGGVCHRWERFEASLRATVTESLHLNATPEIVPAALGEDRNLWGALQLFRQATAARA